MFKSFTFLACMLFTFNAFAQSVAINNTGTPATASAALDVQSDSKGFLVPRMTMAQRQAINQPATGLLVYQTNSTVGFYYNQGTPAAPNWILLGAQGPQGVQGPEGPSPTFNVFSNSSISWLINSPSDYVSGSNVNTTLTLQRGLTYKFNVTVFGHWFRIASSASGPAFNTGVTNNDVFGGVLTFKVPMDAPSQLYYYCLDHPNMNGIINIQ